MDIKSKYIHVAVYIILIVVIAVSGWITYQAWLNPLDLKPEENPKQHDGSQEFNPHQEWESVITPIDEDGVTRHLGPYELWKHGAEDDPMLDHQTIEKE